MSETKPTREEVETLFSRYDGQREVHISRERFDFIRRAYLDQLEEVKRIEEGRDEIEGWVKRIDEKTERSEKNVGALVARKIELDLENSKLRAIVEAARESAQGEVGWSKFDRLLAEWDESGGGR